MKVSPGKLLYTFDLFDTLISRPVRRPAMVFDLMDDPSIQYRFFFLRLAGFKRLRVLSERIARRKSSREDISIFDIYRALGAFIKNPASVLRREVALELSLIEPISPNVSLLQDLLGRGERCLIISDMYLPAGAIRKIIKKHVDERIGFLVSSQEGLTKASGALFRKAADIYKLSFNDIQHFGDNSHSDYFMPKSLGIEAVKLPGLDVLGGGQTLFDSFFLRDGEGFERIGFSLVGPLCYSFASFIAHDAKQRGLKKIAFAARDGYLIKEAFDRLNTGIETSYVRLSRRALYVPSFSIHGDYEKFFEGRVTAEDFFLRLGLVCPEHLTGLKPEKNQEAFISHLEKIEFQELARKDAHILKSFLQQQGLTGDVGFVDLGWRASLQASIQTLLQEECRIHGYYFGSIVKADRHSAFYFENGRPFHRCAVVFQALPVFEFLFTEPIHSLARISQSDSGGFDYEFVLDEPQFQIQHREEIAKGCRRFFDIFYKALPYINAEPPSKFLDNLLANYLVTPGMDFVKLFSGVGHSEGFGGTKYESLLSHQEISFNEYRNSYWRSAYAATAKSGFLKFLHSFLYSRLGMFLILNKNRVLRILTSVIKS